MMETEQFVELKMARQYWLLTQKPLIQTRNEKQRSVFMSSGTHQEIANTDTATKDDIARLEDKIIALDGKLNLVQWIAGSSVAIGLANLYLILRILQATLPL